MFTAHIQALLWTPAPPELSEHLTSKQSAQVQAAQLTNQINTNHLTSHVIAFPMLCAHFTNLIAPVAEYVPIEVSLIFLYSRCFVKRANLSR